MVDIKYICILCCNCYGNACLHICLVCFHHYRWKKLDSEVDNERDLSAWRGVFGGCVWTLNQDQDFLRYEAFTKPATEIEEGAIVDMLKDYFQLDVDLDSLVKSWCAKDKHIERLATSFCGIRQLRQDPVENLFSFICSSNNNIKRYGAQSTKHRICIAVINIFFLFFFLESVKWF